MWRAISITSTALVAAGLLAHAALAEDKPPHDMRAHEGPMQITRDAHARHATPTLSGQDAFAAISEVVALLDADPATDWTKVDLERLRQHLIDMNEVTLHAQVAQKPVPGGLEMDVTGTGRTGQAIRAIVAPHAAEIDRMPEWSATATSLPNGVRLTVAAKNRDDERAIARIRGLGFIGLLTAGAHHAPHHLAIARGEGPHEHAP